MKSSARALLEQIIDYAGLFPPAKLSMNDAVQTYFRSRSSSPHQWMLGRFVCPAARLQELLPMAQTCADRAVLQVSALGQQSIAMADFWPQLNASITAIKAFRDAWGVNSVIDMIELPTPCGCDAGNLRQLADLLNQADLRGFLEIPRSANWHDELSRISQDLGSLGSRPGVLGLKLRCGGLSADAFPTHAQVACFIDRCRQANVPWKATAGLHHPRQHWDESLQLWHHGFLNVFIAGVLANVHSLAEEQIRAIVAASDMASFRVDENSLGWKDWTCTAKQIATARADFATTFGSCSFEEPCQELIALGLLSAGASG